MSKKVYLSGSTQEGNKGVGTYGTEAQRMQALADKVKDYIWQGKGDIVTYRNNGSWTLQQSINDSNSKNPDLHLALHSNAGGGRGTEIYYWHGANNADSKRFADLVYVAVAPLTIANDRGCMPDSVLYTNGLAELRETTATAALIEIMFHDNINDVNDYLGKVDVIAKAIALAIYKYLGINYYIEPPKPVGTERERAIKKIIAVSDWANSYIGPFDDLQNKGINVWGLINKLKAD